MTVSDNPSLEAPRAAGPKWKRLVLIVVGGAVALAGIRLTPTDVFQTNANKLIATLVCSLIIGLLVCAWIYLDSGLRRVIRLGVLLAFLAAVGAGLAVYRVERPTFGGDMQPRFAYRPWFAKLRGDTNVGPVAPSGTAQSSVDLKASEFDSPSFLGPTHDGKFRLPAGKKLARDWTARPPKQLWRVPIGRGWSSFAVVGDYGFTQQQIGDEEFEQVTCYDLKNGKVAWSHNDAPGHYWALGGYGPRATPFFHEGWLFTLGSAGLLQCFDAATGKVVWKHDVVTETSAPIPDWGKSSSPLIVKTQAHGDVVVVSVGGGDGKSLVAYRAADGTVAWSGGDDPSGYATPVEAVLGGMRQILIVNAQAITGHDVETGRVLWRYDSWSGGNPKVPQPIVLDDRRVFISAGYGVGCRMLEITKDGDAWKVDEKYKSTRFKPKFMNPIVRDAFAYGLDDGEFLMCVDVQSGTVKWRSKRDNDYGHGQILMVDDLLVVLCEHGDVALVEAKPDGFNELGRFPALPTGVSWNQPVLIGTRLLVRNDEEAACYELPTE
ncbi:MAG: PQQ-like beta-propeller repeat protein [Planctomycetes bacterium]|nr:PQQ-like beta-propeller repeat protein [Planctomycetota bacterium]